MIESLHHVPAAARAGVAAILAGGTADLFAHIDPSRYAFVHAAHVVLLAGMVVTLVAVLHTAHRMKGGR